MSRLPTLNGLQAFEATARHMSFQKAAEELNLTPSALSYQVKTLEDQLGVALFERRNRSIVFTDDGSRLYPEVREGFERLRLGLRRRPTMCSSCPPGRALPPSGWRRACSASWICILKSRCAFRPA